MGAPLADPAALAGWLSLPPFEEGSSELLRAQTVISAVSDLARGEASQPTWEMDTVPANVAAIVLMVAVETWSRGDGKTSITVEEVTRRWERGDLFSQSQLNTLRGFRPSGSGGLSSVQFTRGMTVQAVRTPVAGGGSVTLYDGRGY